MSKLLIKVNYLKDLKIPCDGYIIGIEKFSCNFSTSFSYEEIKNIDSTNKEIFVAFNRPIFNEELKEYKNMLLKIDSLGLSGIIFNDVSTLTYNLKTKLIIDQNHLNNNFMTINHYYNNGVYGTVLTNDITKDEINIIKENTKSLLFKQAFGLEHLSTSVRKLISNYAKYKKIKIDNNKKIMSESKENKQCIIIEDDFGTYIFSSEITNLIMETTDIKADYFIIDGYLLDDVDINCVVKAFLSSAPKQKEKMVEYVSNIHDCVSGFINKKTVYKVKKHD
ncbi:MAG: U32 family peptidase [Bacilli bacterium]